MWVLSKREVRRPIGGVLKSLASPVLFVPFSAMFGWIALELWVGVHLSLWSVELLSETVVWVVATAVVLWMNITRAAEDPAFFRRALKGTVGVAVFTELFINLFVLGFWWEFVLQPTIAFLSLAALVAGQKREHWQVKRVLDWWLALMGLGFFGFAAVELFNNWRTLDAQGLARQFLLPVWLTVGILPFLWLLSFYVILDGVLRSINWTASDRLARWRTRWAVLREAGLRRHELAALTPVVVKRVAAAPSVEDARAVIGGVRRERIARERAQAASEERVRRYAGSAEMDSEGRRLDRREFVETMNALQTLAVYQDNWYRMRGSRYSKSVLGAVGADFTRDGLPRDAGIELRVARNGRAWFAWRRTISGWCFAIGASAPPPSRWFLDGPGPPGGFPGQHPCWGKLPQPVDVRRNWDVHFLDGNKW